MDQAESSILDFEKFQKCETGFQSIAPSRRGALIFQVVLLELLLDFSVEMHFALLVLAADECKLVALFMVAREPWFCLWLENCDQF
jgi:hypothetical protein